MEPIRYRPGEAIRWLETGAEASRQEARRKGRDFIATEAGPAAKLGQGLGAIVDFTRGAWADVVHRQAEASEYVLQDDRFDVVSGNAIKSVRYEDVKKLATKGEKTTVTLARGATLVIKPYAYIVAGRIRVPVGWMRNGMEVPFELLIEELSARCGVEVEAA